MRWFIYFTFSLFNLLFKVNLLAKHVGKSPEEVEADIRRPKYFSPSEAVEYGIIDKVSQVERVHNNFFINLFAILLPCSWIFFRYYTMKEVLKTGELSLTWKKHNLFDCRKTWNDYCKIIQVTYCQIVKYMIIYSFLYIKNSILYNSYKWQSLLLFTCNLSK